jgi:hypothetical protein
MDYSKIQVWVWMTYREPTEGRKSWLAGNGFQPLKLTLEELQELARTCTNNEAPAAPTGSQPCGICGASDGTLHQHIRPTADWVADASRPGETK